MITFPLFQAIVNLFSVPRTRIKSKVEGVPASTHALRDRGMPRKKQISKESGEAARYLPFVATGCFFSEKVALYNVKK